MSSKGPPSILKLFYNGMDVQKSQIVLLLARQFSHPLGYSGIAEENTLKVLRE